MARGIVGLRRIWEGTLRFFDRFTRDEVSAKVWWPLALVGVVALVLSVPLANRAADRTRADAADWAAATSEATIEPLTSSGATECGYLCGGRVDRRGAPHAVRGPCVERVARPPRVL